MSEKRQYVRETLSAGQSKTYNYTQAIPDGTKWSVDRFICSAQNINDGLSVSFTLKWAANNEVLTVHITDCPAVIPVNREYIGNGTKKLKMVVTNTSASSREISFAIDGNDLT